MIFDWNALKVKLTLSTVYVTYTKTSYLKPSSTETEKFNEIEWNLLCIPFDAENEGVWFFVHPFRHFNVIGLIMVWFRHSLSLSAPFFFFFVFNLYLTNVVNNAQSHCNRIVNTYLHGVLYCEQFIYFQGGWWIKWIDETFFFYSLLFSSSFLRCVCAVAFFFSPVFFLFAFSAFFSSGLR